MTDNLIDMPEEDRFDCVLLINQPPMCSNSPPSLCDTLGKITNHYAIVIETVHRDNSKRKVNEDFKGFRTDDLLNSALASFFQYSEELSLKLYIKE